MTASEFINQYNGKGTDYDGNYGYQCVDLYHFYCRDVVGCTHPAVPGAKDIWNNYDSAKLDRIANTPTFVPKLGDIAIWNMSPYGHVAICTGVGDTNTFQSLDQNWPYGLVPNWNPAKICTHYYNNFLGVLRPKGGQMEESIKQLWAEIAIKQQALEAHQALIREVQADNKVQWEKMNEILTAVNAIKEALKTEPEQDKKIEEAITKIDELQARPEKDLLTLIKEFISKLRRQ